MVKSTNLIKLKFEFLRRHVVSFVWQLTAINSEALSEFVNVEIKVLDELDSTRWFYCCNNKTAELKRGRMSCQDRTSQWSTKWNVTTPEMVKKVLTDHRLKVRDLADMVGISKSEVHGILILLFWGCTQAFVLYRWKYV